jgi:chromosome segregation ATPase
MRKDIMDNETCEIIRDSIKNKINDMDERLKLSISSLNEKTNLALDLQSKLLSESMNNINNIIEDHNKYIENINEKIELIKNDNNETKRKLERICDNIENIENKFNSIIQDIDNINKDIIKNDYSISSLKNDIEIILKTTEKLSNELDIEVKFTTDELNKMPKILKMYDSYIKYKYVIVGIIIVILLISGLDTTIITTSLLSLLGL